MDITNSTEYIKVTRAKFESYSIDWEKAYFDEKSGGFNVYHKDHKFSDTGGGGNAEKIVGKMLANQGKHVEFLPEGWKKLPDLRFDGKTWDIKYIDNSNEETIRAAIRDARKADNAIFYFTKESQYQLLKNASDREIGRFVKGQTRSIPDIFYFDKEGIIRLI